MVKYKKNKIHGINTNYIIWNDFNSRDYYLIEELSQVPTAEEKIDFIEIDGRSGYLTQSQNSYSPIDYEVQLNFYKKEDIRIIKNIFKGNGKLILSHEPDKFYYARVIGVIEFNRIAREYHTCTIKFRLQPYAYEVMNKPFIIYEKEWNDDVDYIPEYTIRNKTNTSCEPTITINGTGDCILIIGDNQIRITDIQDSITLNFKLKDAYKESNNSISNMNTHINGELDDIPVGNTTITWIGNGINEIILTTNFRWL